jgi:hypothetical protein
MEGTVMTQTLDAKVTRLMCYYDNMDRPGLIAALRTELSILALQGEAGAKQDYDCVTRESAENAIEYMSSYNGRGREIDAQAMLVTAPQQASIGGEATDARMLLIHSLVASKGWNHGYSAAFVDDWFHSRAAVASQKGTQ